MSDQQESFRQTLLEHARKPRNVKSLALFQAQGHAFNAICGDFTEVSLCVHELGPEKVIEDIALQVRGCTMCTASASLMSEIVKEQTVSASQKIMSDLQRALLSNSVTVSWPADLNKLVALSPIRQSRARLPCALLPWHALENALKQILIMFFCLLTFTAVAGATNQALSDDVSADKLNDKLTDKLTDKSTTPVFGHFRPFDLRLKKDPLRPRSFFPAVANLILPGFDQWWEGQTAAAFTYSGYAFSGLWLNVSSRVESKDVTTLSARRDSVRQAMLGLQMYQMAGSLSAYHSFRSAVRTRQPEGQYAFLKQEEHVGELLKAPFKFSLLARATTYVPLGLITGAGAFYISTGDSRRARIFRPTDAFYTSAISYQAGVHEEALFRGMMMPMFMQGFESEFWSNTATAAVFAAIHLSSENPLPLPQFILGWYLGWLTQKNNWTLAESIFIHAWWDVIAIAIEYLDQPGPAATLYVPLVSQTF